MSKRIPGLTDGSSSRILRAAANRSILAPSLETMKQTQTERTEVLHGRLEELLVFEVLKDGYVLQSIGLFLLFADS